MFGSRGTGDRILPECSEQCAGVTSRVVVAMSRRRRPHKHGYRWAALLTATLMTVEAQEDISD
jgi:hypothetical protein